MKRYWVTGGNYTDTSFSTLAPGEKEQRFGPFDSYEAAQKVWQGLAWQTVDDCQSYFTIQGVEQPDEPEFWVVGGVYDSTDFDKANNEGKYGPFATYEEAKKEWQRLAWETVDDANARFRIEEKQVGSDAAAAEPAKLAYRVLTGPDDRSFCERVSQALAEGYVLHGAPALTTKGDQVIVAQALVLAPSA